MELERELMPTALVVVAVVEPVYFEEEIAAG